MTRKRIVAAVAGLLTTTVMVAACSGSGSGSNTSSSGSTGSTGSSAATTSSTGAATPDSSAHKRGGSLTIANVGGQTWPCQFNPFNPAVQQEGIGFIYEPLVYVNLLRNQQQTPMLATANAWSSDKKSITFTIRSGVKWSDGTAFSAKDVAYTFNLLKSNAATDQYSLVKGAGLKTVTTSGNKVTLGFSQPATDYFWYIANLTPIVPEHIFASGAAAKNPATWADTKPVGTGPFTMNTCGANNIEYKANPSYWQKGKPYLSTVEYPAYLDNGPANLDLASGKAQWGGQYIPNIDKFYTSKSPDNHTWSPPVANVNLFPNVKTGPTANVAVRRAIAMAVNRQQVATVGESGEQPAANQTGVVLPTFQKYYDSAAVSSAGYASPDTDKAKAALASAGYSPSKPLNLSVITVTGYTDWDASLAVIKQNLAPIGINLTVQDMAQQSYNTKLYNGQFQLAYGTVSGGPTPYYEMRQLLYSKFSAPIGTSATGNYERYNNPQVDTWLDSYATADAAGQVALVKKISGAMLNDVPVIPMTESVDWFQYNTKDIDGWPTQENPYAQPAPFNIPDNGQVLANVYSKSAQ